MSSRTVVGALDKRQISGATITLTAAIGGIYTIYHGRPHGAKIILTKKWAIDKMFTYIT